MAGDDEQPKDNNWNSILKWSLAQTDPDIVAAEEGGAAPREISEASLKIFHTQAYASSVEEEEKRGRGHEEEEEEEAPLRSMFRQCPRT
jgi:hypothetical protein